MGKAGRDMRHSKPTTRSTFTPGIPKVDRGTKPEFDKAAQRKKRKAAKLSKRRNRK